MKQRKIEKELSIWQIDDGEYIHLAALKQALPKFRWDLYLVGITSSDTKIHRTKPLLGRIRQQSVVVLMSSMFNWLTHYNPEKSKIVEAMIDDLRLAEREYMAKLNMIRAEVKAKSVEVTGPKKKEKQKFTKPLKVTSNEIFGAWK